MLLLQSWMQALSIFLPHNFIEFLKEFCSLLVQGIKGWVALFWQYKKLFLILGIIFIMPIVLMLVCELLGLTIDDIRRNAVFGPILFFGLYGIMLLVPLIFFITVIYLMLVNLVAIVKNQQADAIMNNLPIKLFVGTLFSFVLIYVGYFTFFKALVYGSYGPLVLIEQLSIVSVLIVPAADYGIGLLLLAPFFSPLFIIILFFLLSNAQAIKYRIKKACIMMVYSYPLWLLLTAFYYGVLFKLFDLMSNKVELLFNYLPPAEESIVRGILAVVFSYTLHGLLIVAPIFFYISLCLLVTLLARQLKQQPKLYN